MTRLRAILCVVVGLLLTTGWLAGQDDKKDSPTAVRGQLPTYWKQLGLSKDQVQTVYKIQSDYRPKIDDLKQKITKLQAQEKAELEKVLTPAQKERLREIIAGKAPSDTKDKKPGDKPGDK